MSSIKISFQDFIGFKNGEHQAFKRIYEYFYAPAYRRAFVLLKSRMEDAEDAVQETLRSLWLNKDQIKDLEHLERWTYLVLRNKCFKILEGQTKMPITNIDDFEISGDISPDTTRMIEEEYLKNVTELSRVFLLLPENYAYVLKSRFLWGKSIEETAKVLNIKPENCSVLQTRALQKLRELFKDPSTF